MQPIVNGLQDTYANNVQFLSFNAQDGGEGESIFQSLGLRGHPAIVIFSMTGDEAYRQLGVVDDITLMDLLDHMITP